MSTQLLVTHRQYIDVDFLMPMHPETGNVGIKKSINAVKQSILHLMQLKSGDKPFHPEIKSPIYEFLFENNTSVVQVVLEDAVKSYLNVYEPRVIINQVRVTFPSPNEIQCEIIGQIINLQVPITVNILINRLR